MNAVITQVTKMSQ